MTIETSRSCRGPTRKTTPKALFDLLTDKDRYALEGVDAKRARLLLGSADSKSGEGASRQNILDSLKWLAEKAGPNDPVFFAFFGEGAPLGDQGDRHCYLAGGLDVPGRDNNAVSAAEIGDALKGLKSQQFAVFLDVNFKGFTPPADGKPIPEPTFTDRPFAEFAGEAGFGDFQERTPGRVLFLPDHLVIAVAGRTRPRHLCHGPSRRPQGRRRRRGQGGGRPRDRRRAVRLPHQAGRGTRPQVRQDRQGKGAGRHQPVGAEQSFCAVAQPQGLSGNAERLAKFERLVRDGKVSAEIAAEGRQYLGRTPRLESRREAQDYQKLADGEMSLADSTAARDKC